MILEQKLAEMGFILPVPAAPVANYVPFVQTGSLLVISGQLCLGADGKIAPEHKGKIGTEVSVETAQHAASLCIIQLLAQVKAAIGDFSKISRCVRLGGFLNAAPGFAADLPRVMNGASDLIVALMGEAGRHARTTIGVAELPFDAAVEVEGLFELTP
jgi:enamine deaminase RidA (YjgF/YER057c/UK114 family)